MPPLFLAIGGAISAFSISSFIVGSIISTVLSFGLSLIAKAFTTKPTFSTPKVNDTRSDMVVQAIPPRRSLRGQIWTAGPLAWPPDRHSGATNEYIHYLVLLASHECEEIGDMKFDGELIPLDIDGNATGRLAGHCTVEKFLGMDDQAASPLMLTSFPGTWTEAHQLKGITYAHIRILGSNDLFPNGHPNITFQVKGKKVLDIRLSPPVETWNRNPALHLRDYLLETHPDLGMGIPSEEVNDEYVIAAANICDEQVEVGTSSPSVFQDRYTIDGDHYSPEKPADLVPHFLEAMAGDLVYSSGEFLVIAGAWRTPTDLPGADTELTKGDMRGPLKVQGKQPIATVYNGVRGNYIPADSTEPRDFQAYQSATYLAADDDEERWLDVTYRFVDDNVKCQRLSKIKVETSRRPLAAEIPCKVRAWALTPGDNFSCTLAALRWASKTFRVEQSGFLFDKGPRGFAVPGCDLAVREFDEAVYDWDPATDEADDLVSLPVEISILATTDVGTSFDSPEASNGNAVSDLTTGSVYMTHACGLCNWGWYVTWSDFAPTSPIDDADILHLYAVGWFRDSGSGAVPSIGAGSSGWNETAVGAYTAPEKVDMAGTLTDTYSEFISVDLMTLTGAGEQFDGMTPNEIIADVKISMRLFQTVSSDFSMTLDASAVRLKAIVLVPPPFTPYDPVPPTDDGFLINGV